MSGARVDLPSQSTIPCHNSDQASFFRKVIASSAPTGNCLVAALCSNGRLAFCRPSAKSWTLIEEKGHHEQLNFVDVEIIDGKLYGATKQASKFLVVIDIQDGNADGHPTYTVEGLVMLQPWPVPLRMVSNKASSRVYTRHVLERIHLAKDSTSNDLFLILRKNSYVLENDPAIPWSVIIGDENFNSPPRTRGFRVFKLENGTPGHAEWVEIDNLGDRILFLSEAANKIVAVNNGLDYDHRAEILEGNCIYYAYDNPYLSSPSFDTFCKRNFASPARELDCKDKAAKQAVPQAMHSHDWLETWSQASNLEVEKPFYRRFGVRLACTTRTGECGRVEKD
ncbi:hypothetical protein ACLB2K_019333 [Fragaria x ananassa]